MLVLLALSWSLDASASPSARLIFGRGPGAESCPDEAVLRTEVSSRIGYDPFFPYAPRTVVLTMGGSGAKLTARIEAGLGDGLGYEVPVYLRTDAEVAAIAAHQPFPAEAVAASKGKVQVQMLAAKPSTAAAKRALALASDEDRLAITGRELYWLPSGGISESDLDLKAIDAALGPGTMRTIGTVEQIAAKYCG